MNKDYTRRQPTLARPHHIRRPRSARGATLIELLIALAITAILMTAVAVAVDTAFKNYQTNQNLADVSVAARNTVQRMRTSIRSAFNDPCDADPSINAIIVGTAGLSCSFTDANGQNIRYAYDVNSKQLTININSSANTYVLLDDVYPIADATPIFTPRNADATEFSAGTLERVEIRFQVARNNLTHPISASVVPRNIVFH